MGLPMLHKVSILRHLDSCHPFPRGPTPFLLVDNWGNVRRRWGGKMDLGVDCEIRRGCSQLLRASDIRPHIIPHVSLNTASVYSHYWPQESVSELAAGTPPPPPPEKKKKKSGGNKCCFFGGI
jgi:hypothetical protein